MVWNTKPKKNYIGNMSRVSMKIANRKKITTKARGYNQKQLQIITLQTKFINIRPFNKPLRNVFSPMVIMNSTLPIYL